MQVSHLAQHTKGAGATGYTLAQRSFLGGILPESLLYVLHTAGPAAFAAALAGDSDTPELLWTHRMRGQRLVPQVIPMRPQSLLLPMGVSWLRMTANEAFISTTEDADVPGALSL